LDDGYHATHCDKKNIRLRILTPKWHFVIRTPKVLTTTAEEFVVKSTFGTIFVEPFGFSYKATCYDTILISAKYLYPKQRSRFTTTNPLKRPDRGLLRQIFTRARYTIITTCSHRAKPVLLDVRVKFTQIVDCYAIIFRNPSEAFSLS
jgi:hypothetical protein